MKRTAGVAILVLLLALAFFLHRSPEPEAPRQAPRPAPVVEAPPPAPEAIAVAPKPPPAPPPVPPSRSTPVPAPILPRLLGLPGTAILRGAVKVLGEPPRQKTVRTDSDPKCAAMHPGPILSDAIVVDRDGGVKWAFVYVASGINNQPPGGPLPPVLLDQVKCVFEPHVLGVQVGQPLNIFNTDGILHVAHGSTLVNREFNYGLMDRDAIRTVTFTQPEMMVKVKCDIHPWMTAWIAVMDHPYFCVTDATGSYAIPNLPAGRYTVQVWHERYATVAREIDVPPGTDLLLDFVLDARK